LLENAQIPHKLPNRRFFDLNDPIITIYGPTAHAAGPFFYVRQSSYVMLVATKGPGNPPSASGPSVRRRRLLAVRTACAPRCAGNAQAGKLPYSWDHLRSRSSAPCVCCRTSRGRRPSQSTGPSPRHGGGRAIPIAADNWCTRSPGSVTLCCARAVAIASPMSRRTWMDRT
jgi:hypothetical protein